MDSHNNEDELKCSKENLPKLIEREIHCLENLIEPVKSLDILESMEEPPAFLNVIVDGDSVDETELSIGLMHSLLLDQIYGCYTNLHHFITMHKKELTETDLVLATGAINTASNILMKTISTITLNITEE